MVAVADFPEDLFADEAFIRKARRQKFVETKETMDLQKVRFLNTGITYTWNAGYLHHPVRPHIRFLCIWIFTVLHAHDLWCKPMYTALHTFRQSVITLQRREAKVANLDVKLVIQQNIVGF